MITRLQERKFLMGQIEALSASLALAREAMEKARLILAAGVSCDVGADCRPCEAMREAMHAIGEALEGAA